MAGFFGSGGINGIGRNLTGVFLDSLPGNWGAGTAANIANPDVDIYGNPNYVRTPAPQNNKSTPSDGRGVLGDNSVYQAPSSGGGGGTDYSAQLGQISAQEAAYQQALAKLQGGYGQGYQNIDDNYQKSLSNANLQQDRATQNYNTQITDTEAGKDKAIGTVDTNARTLANSLRQMLGLASGSGSSAYQVTAPGAVNRKASLERGDVQSDFGKNFRNIDTAKKTTDEDYNSLLGELSDQRNTSKRDFETQMGEQYNQIQGNLADLAAQKSAYQGGNASAIASAGAPIRADIASRDAQLNSLFDKYRTAPTVRSLSVAPVDLKNYTVDKGTIGGADQQQTVAAGTPYVDPFGKKKDDGLNPLY